MKKILVACGAGVCTSTVALQKLKGKFEDRGLIDKVKFGQCSIADLGVTAPNYDLVITTAQISEDYGVPIIFGLSFITGIGIDQIMDQIISKLGL